MSNLATVDTLLVADEGTFVDGADAIVTGATPIVAESFELKVSAATGAGTLTFTNVGGFGTADPDSTVVVAAGATAAEVAAAIVAVGTFGLYTATLDPTDSSIVLFTETAPGTGADIVDNVEVADVVTTGTGVVVTVENTIDGAAAVGESTLPAVAEVFTVTFGIPTVDGNIAFDGDSVPVLMNDSAIDVGVSVAAGTYINWTAVDNGDGTVTFTAVTAGDVADVTDADFVGANVVVATTPVAGTDFDMLDFSDYGVVGVYVGTDEFIGTAVVGEKYVQMTEIATNLGEYEINVYTEAGTTDALVDLIGVADFGATQAFVAENFII